MAESLQQPDPVSPRTAWWTLAVLSLVAMLDWADRAIIGALAEPIRQEFSLSDTQLGLAMGFSAVALRIVCGFPIGRLTDSWNRRNVLALSLLFGQAVGPQYVGFVSDWLEPLAGVNSLRFSLLSTQVFSVWAAVHFFMAARTVREDYERARD